MYSVERLQNYLRPCQLDKTADGWRHKVKVHIRMRSDCKDNSGLPAYVTRVHSHIPTDVCMTSKLILILFHQR